MVNELAMTDYELMVKIMDEYQDKMDTVNVYPIYKSMSIAFIPSIYDVCNAVPNTPYDEAAFHIIRIGHQYKIFLRHRDEYMNFPLVEVW